MSEEPGPVKVLYQTTYMGQSSLTWRIVLDKESGGTYVQTLRRPSGEWVETEDPDICACIYRDAMLSFRDRLVDLKDGAADTERPDEFVEDLANMEI